MIKNVKNAWHVLLGRPLLAGVNMHDCTVELHSAKARVVGNSVNVSHAGPGITIRGHGRP